MPTQKIPVLHTEETDEYGTFSVETELPWKWEICGSCSGNATTSRHVECDGGGFTGSEWAEQDEDFRRDYLAGNYDRPCPDCEGGKVKVADTDRMTPEQIKAYDEQLDDDAADWATRRAEMRMGC